MAVRPHVPWHWRAAQIAAVIAVAVTVAWAYSTGSVRTGGADPTQNQLRDRVQRQDAALAELRARIAQSDRQLQIERAAAGDLARQVKQLAFDNAALKEDLAFFQSLAKSDTERAAGISVNRLRLQPGAVPGEYRYQLLLVQSGERKNFRGRLEFLLDVQQDGKRVALLVPAEAERGAADYQLDFKLFQRVEGTFRVAQGTEVKSMQVRVFENASRTPKLAQTVSVF